MKNARISLPGFMRGMYERGGSRNEPLLLLGSLDLLVLLLPFLLYSPNPHRYMDD